MDVENCAAAQRLEVAETWKSRHSMYGVLGGSSQLVST